MDWSQFNFGDFLTLRVKRDIYVIWILLCVLVAVFAGNKGKSAGWAFF